MWPVFPGTLTLAVAGASLVLVMLAMRIIQPEWWSSRAARATVLVAFGAIATGLGVWAAGRAVASLAVVHAGAGLAYVGVLVVLPAALVMPAAAALDRVLVAVTGRRAAPPAAVEDATATDTTPRALLAWSTGEPASRREASSSGEAPRPRGRCDEHLRDARLEVSRRAVIRFGSASLPAMAAIGSASGFVQSRRDPTMPIVRLRYPNLHRDLEGLRILHLSDLHLGVCLGLEDLARGLAIARAAHRPDLIVLTGDLADDAALIPGALRLVAEVNARYGAVASLGNHEYLHDIAVTRPLYEASPVPLLVGSGRSLRVGAATLFVGGADDPVHMGGDIPWFLTPSIEAAAAEAPSGAAFRLLLCHRPEGFGPATLNGFDLTLSGHTHGGQLGLFGRSVLEKIKPGIGWWGTYSKRRPPAIERRARSGPGGPSRLYTTSGFGHWFPFRIGCPTEMPVIVLEGETRAKSAGDRA